jgi:hypothetical protein
VVRASVVAQQRAHPLLCAVHDLVAFNLELTGRSVVFGNLVNHVLIVAGELTTSPRSLAPEAFGQNAAPKQATNECREVNATWFWSS